jgi:hypothetical protein
MSDFYMLAYWILFWPVFALVWWGVYRFLYWEDRQAIARVREEFLRTHEKVGNYWYLRRRA